MGISKKLVLLLHPLYCVKCRPTPWSSNLKYWKLCYSCLLSQTFKIWRNVNSQMCFCLINNIAKRMFSELLKSSYCWIIESTPYRYSLLRYIDSLITCFNTFAATKIYISILRSRTKTKAVYLSYSIVAPERHRHGR